MEIDVALSPSPVPIPFLLTFADSSTFTSPFPTESVACFTYFTNDPEFVAAETEHLLYLEIQFQKRGQILEQMQQKLSAKAQESKLLYHSVISEEYCRGTPQ